MVRLLNYCRRGPGATRDGDDQADELPDDDEDREQEVDRERGDVTDSERTEPPAFLSQEPLESRKSARKKTVGVNSQCEVETPVIADKAEAGAHGGRKRKKRRERKAKSVRKRARKCRVRDSVITGYR